MTAEQDMTEYGYCSSAVCPPLSVSFDSSGIPGDDFQASGFFPLVLQNTSIWTWFFFYSALAIAMKHISCRMYPVIAKEEKARHMDKLGRREDLAHYSASCVHAWLSCFFSLIYILNANDIVDAPLVTGYFVVNHAFGYFLSDMIILPSRIFVVHHLAPLLYVEIMLRIGGSLYHGIWFGAICESANSVTHLLAITHRSNSACYYRVFKWAHCLTRPLSGVAAVLIFLCDVPLMYRWTWGLAILGTIFGVWGSNVAFFVTLMRNNVLVVAGNATAGRFSIGALFSARFGRQKLSKEAMVGPRLQAANFSPYRHASWKMRK